MKFTCIELLEKHDCLLIAQIIRGLTLSDDELLEFLPDYLFGETLNVEMINDYFVVYDFDGESTWHIPPYFVKKVMNKFV